MSENDSFITEVTDEVRRDKLFKTFKKYSWVLALAVAAIVGGTGYNEYVKAKTITNSQLAGDLMIVAADTQSAETFAEMAADGTPSAVLANFQLSAILAEQGDMTGAVAALSAISGDGSLAEAYTDLALLKMIVLVGPTMDAEGRNNILSRLLSENDPYRLLALEQRALQHVRDGDNEAALTDLNNIIANETVTQGLRNRAQELIISLGGTLETSSDA